VFPLQPLQRLFQPSGRSAAAVRLRAQTAVEVVVLAAVRVEYSVNRQ